MSVLAVACGLGAIEATAQAADVAPPNPPRSQQEMMRERRDACRDLRGSELKECMANYVGKAQKSENAPVDRRPHDSKSDKPSPPPEDSAPAKH